MACAYLDLDCKVFMVKVSYEQKPFRREVMRTFGASVTPSPSMETEIGKKINAEHPGTTGSLGCAISEAVEVAVSSDGYRYVLGSVLNSGTPPSDHHRSGNQGSLDKYDIKPDIIVGCAGGGSNLGGLIAPFVGEKLRGEADYRIIAVEPASCPSFTRGKFAYDFCDTGKVCPLAEDVHPGQRIHALSQPRRRPEIPRHEPRAFTALSRRIHGSRSSTSDRSIRGSRSISQDAKASFLHLKAHTPSRSLSTKPKNAKRPVKKRPSYSASPEQDTSTWWLTRSSTTA